MVMIFAITGCGKKESAGKTGEEQGKPSEGAASDNVKQRILSFNLEGLTDKGAKKWDIEGESAEAITENRIKLNNVTARAYGDEAMATITGDTGMYDKLKNNVTLDKNVKVVIENAAGFSKDFINLPGEAAAPDKAKKTDFDKAKKADSGKEKKAMTVITCDGEAEFNYERNQAFFRKNVKVVSEDGLIDADKMTLDLDMTTKKLKDVIAEGNVKITRGENISYSDMATYLEPEKRIVLSGNPKLFIYQEGEIKGSLLGNIDTTKK